MIPILSLKENLWPGGFYGVLKSIRTFSVSVGRVNSFYVQKERN